MVRYHTAAQYNFRDPRQARKLSDLISHIIAINRFDGRPQLLRQMDVRLKARLIRLGHPLKFLCFHKQRGKAASEGAGHAGCGAYDFFIGRRRGKAYQDMVMCVVFRFVLRFPGI